MVAKVPGLIPMYKRNRGKERLAPRSSKGRKSCSNHLFLFHWSQFRNKPSPEPVFGKGTLRQGRFPRAAGWGQLLLRLMSFVGELNGFNVTCGFQSMACFENFKTYRKAQKYNREHPCTHQLESASVLSVHIS